MMATKKPANKAEKPVAKKAPAKPAIHDKKPAEKPKKTNTKGGAANPKIELYADLSRTNPRHARVWRFIDEYVIDFNGTQAAIRAGYAPKSASVTASQLLANPNVFSQVEKLKKEIAERNGLTIDLLIKDWMALAHTDVRRLTGVHYYCCRFCYGLEFGYQRTPNEMKLARERHEQKEAEKKLAIAGYQEKEFDEEGGVGFDDKKDPHPDCPECNGRGVRTFEICDTRLLNPDEALMLLGVECIKGDIKVNVVDRIKALDALSKHMKFYEADGDGNLIPPIDTLCKNFLEASAELRESNEQLYEARKELLKNL